MNPKVGVVGLWHLGSVTAACVAEHFETVAFDFDAHVVEEFGNGKAPVAEPGLNELIRLGVKRGTLSATCNPADLLLCDIIWIAFDTPVDNKDLADVDSVVRAIGQLMPFFQSGTTVLISSQLPTGTTRKLQELQDRVAKATDVTYAYSPENLQLGQALRRFQKPDRIIVGVSASTTRRSLASLLDVFGPVEWMSIESAEMTKHAINAFLALSITFINEIASICEMVGADAKEVERGLKSEHRIGNKAYLSPGGAFAGGTLARDQRFLTELAARRGLRTPVLKAIRASNNEQRTWIPRHLAALFRHRRITTAKIGILGIAYKSGTDTLRRSEAIILARSLLKERHEVTAFDPLITQSHAGIPKGMRVVNEPASVFLGSDAVVVVTDSPVFRRLSATVLEGMRSRVILDPNRVLPETFRDRPDTTYIAVGVAEAIA